MTTYKIARLYERPEKRRRIIETGLTLVAAREHCSDPTSSSHTAATGDAAKHTRENGHWMDAYYREDPRGW